MTITICSEGKEDFIENLCDGILNGKKYKKSDWTEAFGWITINLVCYNCGFEDSRWVDYETM